ncbi:MAG TPA: Gfo/Idh/MocA family oxidoreductase [Bryobacteraceae bacterium]|nr:Gfo/Idh/MocA family oxidoreductase [Bryobacteraceae bacterium]
MKIGVFGLGFMGSTHLQAWKKTPRAELAAVVCDIPKRLEGDLTDVQGNIGGPGERMDFSALAKYTDPYAALEDPNIEAVDICLPTDLHAPVAIAALKAGKHVLVEKPMALCGEEADAMIAAARENKRILMAAQVVRFLPSYSVTAKMIKSGELGPIRAAILRRRCAAPAWSQWLGNKKASGGGVFDLLIHDVDWCLHVFGKPEAISAVGYEDLAHGIDWVTAELFYPEIGGVVVSGGWHHPKAVPFSMEYTIVGECGTVEFDSAGVAPTLYRADGECQPLALPDVDGYQAEIEYFLNCCIEGKEPEFCRPEESAAAVKLTRMIAEARERKGEKIACRL